VRVVFDTNVVVSASLWCGLPFDSLSSWAQGWSEAAVSPELLAEYHETMITLRREYPKNACVGWAEALTDAAILVFPNERARGATPDPGDEKVLECALAAEANVIVTGDKKHLLPLGIFRGVEIMTPANFLKRLPPPRIDLP
jgi:putative PIN family toxin of toxin-antitoxin system